jgi:DNA-binding transcriptional LysR family regulator
MAVNIPTELLRSFVAIIDTGSMLQATERVFVTQSAISLQMRRLEEIVRQPLFNRQGRKLRLTQAGEHLAETAREILALNDRLFAALQGQALSGTARIGLNQDFAEVFLPGVLQEFAIAHPEIQLHVRVAGSQELLDALRAEALDIVLCVRPAGEPNGIKTEPMRWIGQPQLLERDILPLALLEEPCLYRATALKALEESGRPFRIVVETASLSGLRAAVQAALGITCRNALSLGASMVQDLGTNHLPAMPDVSYALFESPSLASAGKRLAALVRQNVRELNALELSHPLA